MDTIGDHSLRPHSEQRRQDVLQALAYANLAAKARVICCLIYPCTPATWDSLQRRGRTFHEAQVPNALRTVNLWLTALPICASAERFAGPLTEKIRQAQMELSLSRA